MSDERSTPEKREPRNSGNAAGAGGGNHASPNQSSQPAKDLVPLLKGWDYEPGTINVRKIFGMDGQPKVQMRLELGILQMEITGRPDGARPHGHESFLDYLETQLKEHKKRHGSDLGFHLTGAQCQTLREEAQLYYQRYLSLFVLEDFTGVVRDTARNLRVLDICGKFAVEEQDRLMLEQFRPYIVMMNARASASIAFKAEKYSEALNIITDALDDIREFFTALGQPEAFSQSSEVRVLRRFARDIRRKMPVDPMQRLQNQLERAVKAERYEEAAKLRDQIRHHDKSPGKSPGAAQ
jgi:hypothetical protein